MIKETTRAFLLPAALLLCNGALHGRLVGRIQGHALEVQDYSPAQSLPIQREP